MKTIISILIAALTLLAGCAAFTSESAARLDEPTTFPPTLWRTLASLSKQFPFSKWQVESILSLQLNENKEYSNRHTKSFIGKNVILADQAVISDVDFRTGKAKPAHPRIFLNNITGACFTKTQVEDRYGELELIASPAEYPNNKSLYRASTPPGHMFFAFHGDAPHCLVYVVVGMD
jgi:hypothetical protein